MSDLNELVGAAYAAAQLREQLGRMSERIAAERSQEALLRRELEAQQAALAGDEARLAAREHEAQQLAAQLAGLRQAVPTSAALLGRALSAAADAIQLRLINLPNPNADFALAELNVELRGALRMGDGGASAQIALADAGSSDPNTARMRARLRPRPRRQQ